MTTLTSAGEWVQRNLRDLKDFLLDRQYPMDIIDKGIHNALLQRPAPKPQEPQETIPLIMTFFENLDDENILQTKKIYCSVRNQTSFKAVLTWQHTLLP